MTRRKVNGPTVLLATILAVCAALIPSSASAAVSTKVTANNGYSVGSCTFTKESTDPIAGTVTYKVNANVRATGFNVFRNAQTYVTCWMVKANTIAKYAYFEGKATINQVGRLTMPIADAYEFCIGVLTFQKGGAASHTENCVEAP